ncbi:DedA family protein [Acidianus manzaensis]|uniref:DedA family protein n=1 Tax=Acidianus manzaensis TaxID=282676 RepID=A0A1W6K366_9CREN|nr:DedA family protein [Acidianus manzaensis]ARM76884.1 DedA family protein [Acidianus manzaensis]
MYEFQGVIGYFSILGLMILEGIGFPIPSEIIMPLTGYYSHQGSLNLFLAVLVGSLGSLTGSIIDYFIGLKLGLPFLKKYGKIFRLTEDKLERLNGWFAKHGSLSVFSLRFVPEIRALISFPAGIASMSLLKFIVFTFAGHIIWDSVLSVLGYIFYNQINYVIMLAEKSDYYILGAFIVVLVIGIIYWKFKK